MLSHFGRPKGQVRPDMSLALLVRTLSEISGRPVRFVEDCQGPQAERAISTMTAGWIAILENVRFHAGEENNNSELARAIAALGDFYVNDASPPRIVPMPRPRAWRICCRALLGGRWRPS